MNSSSGMDFSLSVSPDQSQFFRGNKVTLSCGDTGAVKRNTSTEYNQDCSGMEAYGNASTCWMLRYPGTVVNKGVVLQVPVLPVSPGQTVSLTCRHHTGSAPSARFYSDGQLLSEQPTGQLTLQQVSVSDEGLYQCEIRGEKSQPSPLRLRADTCEHHSSISPVSCPVFCLSSQSSVSADQSPVPPAAFSPLLLGFIVGSVLLVLLVLIIFLVRRYIKQTGDSCPEERGTDDVTYSHILHHQERPPIRRTENQESLVYSTVKTDEVCYSSIAFNQTRGKSPRRVKHRENEDSSVYSSVKTDDVIYSSININQTRDPAKRTKDRTPKQKDSSTYAQIRERTK
ncbi:hypothetical protein WMY93_031943 [Mugilogobius chulae]|uniref:Ig-like domain-containing protein n=1 Tax=Mugilogobius chulae TaxID=88201 RepID=A0AAW0MH49_9GOBI